MRSGLPAVVAARTGARHAVHGLGPLPAEAWDWFGARLGDLAGRWEVPDLPATILDVPYLDNCPPALQADAVRAFREQVIEDFADAYLRGETPIPCIRCNQTVKFRDLLDVAREHLDHKGSGRAAVV